MIDEKLLNRIEVFLKENLKDSRLEHTYAVVDEAVKLAAHYGADQDKARLASLCHDMYKNLSPAAMQMYIRQLDIPERYNGNANLAHSKIAAAAIQRSFDIEDTDIINAVSYHTTGRSGMSLLEKIVFIADAIEPARSYPGVGRIRREAYEDIDRACITSLEGTVEFLKSRKAYIDPDTINALEYFKERFNL